MTYSEKLRDSRWQKKRLEVLQREDFKCQWCKKYGTVIQGDYVQVHHGYYEFGRDPWEYDSQSLFCLCEKHHKRAQYESKFLRRLIGHVEPHYVGFFACVAIFFCGYGKNFKEDDVIFRKAMNFFRIANSLYNFADKNLASRVRKYIQGLQ
jgi:hypothetical protein